MPIYEYRCESCSAELEKLQKISDPALRECPECGKDTLIKMISASSFRLKGSGWYETDFKTGKKKNGAGEASSESSGTSESAPAASTSDGTGGGSKDSKASADTKGGKESAPPPAAAKTSKSSTD